MSDGIGPNLDHPDAAIRLASAVHRFRVPQIGRTVEFSSSFRTAASHPKTRTAMKQADQYRQKLHTAVTASPFSGERVYAEACRYVPLIQQILLTCKVQPEVARLDERLVFEWASGVEETTTTTKASNSKSAQPVYYTSEALMYEVVMILACQGLAKASAATEASIAGDFAAANREYNVAAGVMQFLYQDHLAKWIAKGSNVEDAKLPTECSIGACEAFTQLFLANAQQMAVAMLLVKAGTPNYNLLAKLCLGIAERYHAFVSIMRKHAFDQMSRMGKDVFALVAFQTALQESLSHYFHARALWATMDYGLAIAVLSEAKVGLNTRAHGAAAGMPEISKGSPLSALSKELTDLKAHMGLVLKHWEADNSSVYFEQVPPKVPEDKKLTAGIQLDKAVAYKLDDVDPLPLSIPDGSPVLTRSDSDVARELQEELNREEQSYQA